MLSTEQIVFVNSAVNIRRNHKYGISNLSHAGVLHFKTTKCKKFEAANKLIFFLYLGLNYLFGI